MQLDNSIKFLCQYFKEIKKHNVNIVSGLRNLGEYSIDNGISTLSPVTIIPDVILPTFILYLIVKRKGEKIIFLFIAIGKIGDYFIDHQFKDGRLNSFALNRIVL